MAAIAAPRSKPSPAQWALLALVLSLAVMKPDLAYPVMVTDLLFLLAAALLAAEWALGRRRPRWRPLYLPLGAYWLCLSASILVSADPAATAIKSAATLYLVGLAVLADQLIDDEAELRRVSLAWLAGTGAVAALGAVSLLLYLVAPDSGLVRWAAFHSGTLPPGDYPRLAISFWNANMLCNYLTASLGLLLVARHRGWIERPTFVLLLAGLLIAALSSISPGLGGIALLGGLWLWLVKRASEPSRARAALAAGVAAAAALLVAIAVTPILHPTAPFLVELPGGITLAPSGRYLTWAAAAREWAANPLLGHGLGVAAVEVRYLDPGNYLQTLTDAHNVFLNVAAQSGLIGLAGLLLLIGLAARLTFAGGPADLRLVRLGLGLTWLDAFVYQGLGGSFEDARHLWVLLGLLLAADRLATRPAVAPAAAPA